MPNLTAMECLLLSEHFKSETGMINMLQYAGQNTSDARCRKLCETMLQEHQQQFRSLAQYIEQMNY
ncbi:MAG TPA: hypothetical protein GXX34_05570 [Clostridia bacterium]|nr:hypothetical protein [Clostridia bacterium]